MDKRFEEYRINMMSSTTDNSPLDPRFMEVAEKLAKANHEGWMEGKKKKGYVYGPKNNDNPENGPLTSPLLVPYEELDEETKQANIANVEAIVRIMACKGVIFVSFQQILYSMAEEIHDSWCREKFAAGWVCGDVTDKSNKVHRDLRPFADLLADPELVQDVSYDVDTARKTLIMMISQCDIFPAISSISAFGITA